MKQKKLIAKSIIGKEFLHSRINAFYCKNNALKIADELNKQDYKLNDGETWHIYDADYTMDDYVEREIFMTRNGSVKTRLATNY